MEEKEVSQKLKIDQNSVFIGEIGDKTKNGEIV